MRVHTKNFSKASESVKGIPRGTVMLLILWINLETYHFPFGYLEVYSPISCSTFRNEYDELWNEVCDIVQETGIKTIPMEKKCKKSKMAVWGGLTNSCEKKRSNKLNVKAKHTCQATRDPGCLEEQIIPKQDGNSKALKPDAHSPSLSSVCFFSCSGHTELVYFQENLLSGD